MLNIGGGELLAILLIALIVLGPDKLPDAARQAGKVMREFRRISTGFQKEMRDAMKDPVAAATQERTLQNRVSFEPPAPFAAQKADPEPEAEPHGEDTAESGDPESRDQAPAQPGEEEADADSAAAPVEDSDATAAEPDDTLEGPEDPEVGIPSDR